MANVELSVIVNYMQHADSIMGHGRLIVHIYILTQ